MTFYQHCPRLTPDTALAGGRLTLFKSSKYPRSHFSRERPISHPNHIIPCAQQSSEDANTVAAEFARLLNEREAAGIATPNEFQHRRPSHLLSPIRAVASVLTALQRNNYPEPDAGVETAFSFTKPWKDGELPLVTVGSSRQARNWGALESWLDPSKFSEQLHSLPYSVLLECDDWQPSGPILFPSSRSEARAVQAVAVQSKGRQYNFSFCMEREDEGSLKGCWLIAGVRQGDYSV